MIFPRSLFHSPRGFSLTEITIALGVVAFVLIALLALLNTSLNSQRESAEETARIAVLNYVTAEVRSSTNGLAATNSRFYFDSVGRFLAAQTNATPVAAATLRDAVYVASLTNSTNVSEFLSQGQILVRHPYPNLIRSAVFPISASR